jgi:chemotaxis protein CheC
MTRKKVGILEKLNETHLDALQEVGNIGAGHSATALSQLLNRRVDISVPFVELIPIEEFSLRTLQDPEEPVVVISCETSGEFDLGLVALFDESAIRHLFQVMKKQELNVELQAINAIDRSLIREVANILLLHYVVAINDFMGASLYPQVPSISIDMGRAILDSLISEKGDVYAVLSIRVEVFTDGGKFKSNILALPSEATLDRLVSRLFTEGWSEE